jgi:hypothetical protein
VIVNAVRNVDKPVFFHSLKDLRAFKQREQGLCDAWTETGQKTVARNFIPFRTIRAVDMHGLIHTGGESDGLAGMWRTFSSDLRRRRVQKDGLDEPQPAPGACGRVAARRNGVVRDDLRFSRFTPKSMYTG